MPSSISTVQCEGVPSSSTLSEPRRSGRVPSSTTVTPGAATRCPIRPEKAEVFLRLKSPSRPCPTASCSITPGQPGPSTTRISPAGAGTEPRLPRVEIALIGDPAAGARGTGLHPLALADDDGDAEPHERPDVGDAVAVGAQDLHRLPDAGERGHDLADARIAAAGVGVDLGQKLRLGGKID